MFCSHHLHLWQTALKYHRLQQAEGQERDGAGTNDLLAAQGLGERERWEMK